MSLPDVIKISADKWKLPESLKVSKDPNDACWEEGIEPPAEIIKEQVPSEPESPPWFKKLDSKKSPMAPTKGRWNPNAKQIEDY
jgi:hypothetical protein